MTKIGFLEVPSRRIMQSITDEGQSWFCQHRIGGPLGAVCTLLFFRYYRAGKLLHVGQIGYFAHPSTGLGLTDLFLLRVSWLLNAYGTYLMHVGDSGQYLFNAILLQGTHAFVECVSQ